jgi:hypothetical protein
MPVTTVRARQRILICPLLKRFLHRDLARAASVSHGEGLFHQHFKRRALGRARGFLPSLGITAAALRKPAGVRFALRSGLFAHDAGAIGNTGPLWRLFHSENQKSRLIATWSRLEDPWRQFGNGMKNGQVQIRRAGERPISKTFTQRKDAQEWARDAERQAEQG